MKWDMRSSAMGNRNQTDTISRLPVAAVLDDLKTALGLSPSAVLVAPPGAGKTTAVPLALLDQPWLSGRRMLLLAPRRLAARAAAHRMAALLNQPVGETVGYRVRMESRVGPHTRIEVLTEGVLTRMLQHDPALTGVGLVIFDEFHERSLDADLGLALCRDIQGVLNEALRLLVMSATLDPVPVAALLDDAPLIRCDGRTFPVETRYVVRPQTRPVERAVAAVIRRSIAAGEGNLLVFLPGAPEIGRVARLLEKENLPSGWRVAPLYGNLPRSRQDEAIAPLPAGQHKVVLATSIAETSLTIEQIGVVVDSGLQRAPRFDPGSGMTRLVTLPVSRASADQRRDGPGAWGPASVTGSGTKRANRPFYPTTGRKSSTSTSPGWPWNWQSGELAHPMPWAGWTSRPQRHSPLPAGLLLDLGALDEAGKVTAHGRRMADLPLHPRLAHMLLSAREKKMGATACDIAAILSERDPLHFIGRERDADLKLRLDALYACRMKRPFQIHGCTVDSSAVRRILNVSAMLQHRLGLNKKTDTASEPGRLLAWAYPDRIARQRPGSPGRFLLASGRGAFFASPEPLSASQYLVAANLDGDRREARIFMAVAFDKERLLDQFSDRIRWKESVTWDPRRKAVSAVRQRVFGAITIDTAILEDPAPEAVLTAMIAGIRETGIAGLPWTRGLRTWQTRVMLLRRIEAEGGPWPTSPSPPLQRPWRHGWRPICPA